MVNPKPAFKLRISCKPFLMQVLLKKNFKCFNHGRSIDCVPITFSFYADVVDKFKSGIT